MPGYIARSKTDNWSTPPSLIQELCGTLDVHDPCPANFTQCGLEADWSYDKINWVNPPFSKLAKWTLKAKQEAQKHAKICLLMPARVSTNYFWENCKDVAEIQFIKKRRRFINQETGEVGGQCPFDLICVRYNFPVNSIGH